MDKAYTRLKVGEGLVLRPAARGGGSGRQSALLSLLPIIKPEVALADGARTKLMTLVEDLAFFLRGFSCHGEAPRKESCDRRNY